MSKPEPQMVCMTDHFFALELRDRIERGSPLAPEEWQFPRAAARQAGTRLTGRWVPGGMALSAPSWQLADLREEHRPRRSPTIYRAVATDYTLSANGNAAGNGKTLTGYFSVFDRWTEISSAVEGHFYEKIRPGAFSKTLKERGNRIPVMFSHGADPVIGLQILGRVRDIAEDTNGVRYEVDLFDGLPQLLLEGLRAGSYGASFRAKLIKDQFDPRPGRSSHNPAGLPESIVTELSLREFGPVATPAYADTSAEIRSVTDEYAGGARVAADQRTTRPDPKPSWLLGDDEEPYWQLTNRKDQHALTSARTT
jgi:HK97 family phage prohead protease